MAEGGMDLYADDLEVDLEKGNGIYESSEPFDLYEDVLAAAPPARPLAGQVQVPISVQGAPYRKCQLYIGNLTWWTTDRDIADATANLGVHDILDLKFFEHKPNGQSKGYCSVTFGSERSVNICLEGLPRITLHGNHPVVLHPSKQAQLHFEANCKTRPLPSNPSPQNQVRPINHAAIGPGIRPRMPLPPPAVQRGPPVPMAGHPYHPSPHFWNSAPAQSVTSGPPPQMHRPPVSPVNQRGPSIRPIWNRPPGMHQGFLPQSIPIHQPPPAAPRGPPPIAPPPNTNLHVNPAFFPQGPPPPQTNQMNGPPPGYGPPPARISYPNPPQEKIPVTPVLSEAEFDEIMARNRTVSSSAIARAVSDAGAGEYASAIETLVTAIALIKQSKIVGDDRCKILISSLQDTLHGVESKSYCSSKRDRSRSRERSHRRSRRDRSKSRDREYRDRSRGRDRERDKERYYVENYGGRDRSRSRDKEREYQERSREDRYYEERYRDRDREREREREREVPRREPDRREPDRREPDRREPEREKEKEEPALPHKNSRH